MADPAHDRRNAAESSLFPEERERIVSWWREPGGLGLLVTGPAGSGKTRLLADALEFADVIRLGCAPGIFAGELIDELAVGLLARGDERLHQALRRDAPASLYLEVAKDSLAHTSALLWLEDLDALGRDPIAPLESHQRDRGALLRAIGLARRQGLRLVITAEDRARIAGELDVGPCVTVALPELAPGGVELLWQLYGGAGKPAPQRLTRPLAVKVAARLAAAGDGGDAADFGTLCDRLWDRLSADARRLAAYCILADVPVTQGLVRFLEREAALAPAAAEELLAWGVLEAEGETSNRLNVNPGLAAILRDRAAPRERGELLSLRATLGRYWRESGRRARRLWDLLRALLCYADAGDERVEQELQREVVEELLRRDCLDLSEEILDRAIAKSKGRGRAVALGNLAIVKKNKGEYDRALALYEEAWREFEILRDQPNVARVLHQLGNTYYIQGELETAIRHYEQSRRVALECGDESVGAAAQIQTANVLFLQGELAEAGRHYGESLAIAEKIGDRRMMLAVLLQLGQLNFTRERYLEADENLAGAERLAEELAERVSMAKSLQFRGLVARARGDLEQAVRLFVRAEKMSRELGDPTLEGTASFHVGHAKLEQGDLVAGLRSLGRAAEVFEAHERSEARAVWSVVRDLAVRIGDKHFARVAEEAGVAWMLEAETGIDEDACAAEHTGDDPSGDEEPRDENDGDADSDGDDSDGDDIER